MRALGIVLIMACLVTDMATPMYPGAFRFDPAQSIEGVGARPVTAVRPQVNEAPLPECEALESRSPVPRRVAGVRVAAAPSDCPRQRAGLASAHRDPGPPRSSEED
jgi:hypothetical protein